MAKQPTNASLGASTGTTAAVAAREHVLAGDRLYSQSHFDAAFDHFEKAVQLQPGVPDYHFRLASAAWKLDRKLMVEKHYQEAARLDPSFGEPHKMLAQFFISNGQTDRAMHHSELALKVSPPDADTIITRAVILTAADQPQAALQLLRPLVDSGHMSFHLASAYADVAKKVDQTDQALALISRTLADGKVSPVLARRLHVSAASLLEAAGRYDEAFLQMRGAKKLSAETFDPAAHSQWVSSTIEYFTPRKLRSLPRAMHGSNRPVLIVGMPRSGTSLIEQILASHPAIHGAGELVTLGQIGHSLSTSLATNSVSYPQSLDYLSIHQADRLAAQYHAVIQSVNTEAAYVTDKMPQNFEWLGLAEVLLPDCHIIHCMRDPRDTCVSCFMTDFDIGHGFTNDVAHLAAYYRDYQRLMQHWKDVLTVPTLEVRYEEVVADAEGQTRRMLDFLGLPWEEHCLEFHRNERTVTTASKHQVRQPLYSSSAGRWKRYEKSIPELLQLSND